MDVGSGDRRLLCSFSLRTKIVLVRGKCFEPLGFLELLLLLGEACLTLGHTLPIPQEVLAQFCDLLFERGETRAVALDTRPQTRQVALERLDVL